MPDRLLIVDDEEALRDQLSGHFRRAGYEVATAGSGREALEKAAAGPDLILLDVMLPHTILFLSALGRDEDKLSGFAAGGDEYITKPVSLPVLEAQVAASLRRDRRRAAPASVRFDEELTINYTDRTLRFRGQEIPLARKEFDILALLSQNPGVVLSKERIYERVWGFDSEGDSATVSEHVRRVRGKLSAAGARCPIETVWGCGYRWSRQEA